MKLSHLLVVGILAGFTAFAVIVGCGDQSPMNPESTQIVSAQDGAIHTDRTLGEDCNPMQRDRCYEAELYSPLSDAHGYAKFYVDEHQIKYELKAEGLDGFTAAHIHARKPGEQHGPIALWIYPERPPRTPTPGILSDVTFEGYLDMWDLRATAYHLKLWEIQDLVQTYFDRDLAYVQVHSNGFPAGEIRGDIERCQEPKKKMPPKKKKKKKKKKKAPSSLESVD